MESNSGESSKSQLKTIPEGDLSSLWNGNKENGETTGDCEGDSVVTMVDVLEEEKELEENAFAVLGGSDEKNCTYPLGYISRQALYSCTTCRKNDEQIAAICLACSYACHENHELVELYTKRNFRCDCGNSKFNDFSCTLCPNKSNINENNKYNQNFLGKYCVCERPYPDPENNDTIPMIQCIACEDWFHTNHLKSEVPPEDEFSELVCFRCMDNLAFLWAYYKPDEMKKESKKEEKNEMKVDDNDETHAASNPENSNVIPKLEESKIEKNEQESVKSCDVISVDSGVESSCDSLPSGSIRCKLAEMNYSIPKQGSTFWVEGWRETLCKCLNCLAKYRELNCSFIFDPEDTVKFYEDRGRQTSIQISQYERGLNEINKLDRIKSIEAIHECQNLSTALKDYLKKFAENKKVVREEDIHEFFQEFTSRKRIRNDLSF